MLTTIYQSKRGDYKFHIWEDLAGSYKNMDNLMNHWSHGTFYLISELE